MVISGGKIIETGKKADLEKKYDIRTRLDAKGKFIYPGFIDSHAHFVGYGSSLQRVNLVGTSSWQEVLDKTREFADSRKILSNEWIIGRGWDQNDWSKKEYPNKEELDILFRNNPVLLTRIDGHAAIANQVALDLSRFSAARVEAG